MNTEVQEARETVKFTWLHVSDWHFKSGKNATEKLFNKALSQAIQEIPKAITQAIADKKLPAGTKIDCIIHTGDVANSGATPQYLAAQVALSRLAYDLGVQTGNVTVTAGNHDVADEAAFYPTELTHFRDEGEYVIAQEQWFSRPRLRSILLERFENFHHFKKQHSYPADCEDTKGFFIHLVNSIDNTGAKTTICVAAVNSALVSTRQDHETEAELVLGQLRIRQIVEEIEKNYQNAELRILVFHHPFSFLNPRDALRCWEVIEDKFDIVLYGHKHAERDMMEHLAQTNGFPAIDGGSIDVHSNGTIARSEFAVGQYDPTNNSVAVTYFAWGHALDKTGATHTGEFKYLVGHRRSERQQQPVTEGAELNFRLSHPRRWREPAVAGPLLLLPGTADLAPQNARSSNIVENLYGQRDAGEKHRKEPDPKLILPTKHFFWHVESRTLFESMASRPEYWLETASAEVFEKKHQSMVDAVDEQTKNVPNLTVACLGVGEGRKEVGFFNRLKAKRDAKGTVLLYVDINYQMILKAARRMAESQDGKDGDRLEGLRFVHTDFDGLLPAHLSAGAVRSGTAETDNTVLFVLFGNTFANQFEQALLAQLKGFGKDTLLLFDVPLLDDAEEDELIKGYKTNEGREFTELTLRHFDKRYERKWRMNRTDRITPKLIKDVRVSNVDEAVTVSNLANSPTFGPLWLGMSHRYKFQKLRDFLDAQGWNEKWHSDTASAKCWYALIKPKETSQTQALA